MHDIKQIRKSPDILDLALEKRGLPSKGLEIIELDSERRKTIEKLESMLAERNALSKKIGTNLRNSEDLDIKKSREDIKEIKKEIGLLETKLRDLEKKLANLKSFGARVILQAR